MVFYPAFIVFCRRISLKQAISSKPFSVILSSLIHSQSLIERVFNLLYFQYFRARNKVGVFFALFSHFQTIFLSSFKIPSYFETHAIRPSPPFLLLAAVLSQAPGCPSSLALGSHYDIIEVPKSLTLTCFHCPSHNCCSYLPLYQVYISW